jgi:hypothetical protein
MHENEILCCLNTHKIKEVLCIKEAGNVSITLYRAPFCNHCYKGKAVSVAYSEFVFVVLRNQ